MVKCLGGQKSGVAKSQSCKMSWVAKCLFFYSGEMSGWQNVLVAKCLGRKMSVWKNVWWQDVGLQDVGLSNVGGSLGWTTNCKGFTWATCGCQFLLPKEPDIVI